MKNLQLTNRIIKILIEEANVVNKQRASVIADQIIQSIAPEVDTLFIPPTHDQCFDYLIKSDKLKSPKTIGQLNNEVEAFLNYYESINWKVGKSRKPMKNWKTALVNWSNRNWNNNQKSSRMDELVKAHMKLNS
jgi:hypothetical protein